MNCKSLETITGVENVEVIEKFAFARLPLTQFTWPSNCIEIPCGCFIGSKLKTIENIDHVKKIGSRAFESTPLDKFEWPSACDTMPQRCFCSSDIKTIYNTQAIKRAEPIVKESEDAFFSCGKVEMIPHKEGSGNVEVECTLPAWLSERAEKEGIDLSALLKETLESMVGKPEESPYRYPEAMEMILKYLNEAHPELNFPGKIVEKLYRQFSEDRHCVKWLGVSDEALEEFVEYLTQ